MHPGESTLFISLLTATLALVSILGFLLFSLVRMHRAHLLQLQHRDEISMYNSDEEKQNIAFDLHDDMGPMLSLIHTKVNQIQVQREEDKKRHAEACEYLSQALEKIRNFSFQLAPPILEREGPFYEVDIFLERITEGFPIKASFEPFKIDQFSVMQSLSIYRMLQEIIYNTLKYAQASKLVITTDITEDFLVIRTEDDGRGFDVAAKERKTNGIGLQSLRTRARYLEAELTIESSPGGGGTRHTIKIPINQKDDYEQD